MNRRSPPLPALRDNPIERLALSFPTLHEAAGVCPWEAVRLDAWACGPAPGSGALHAARFVLAVWDNAAEWRCGRFDAVEALASWDAPHRGAFLTWVAKPWWA
jgi:hypothetical protein